MKTIEIPTDDPTKMIRAIREQIYEETKDMTPEQWAEHLRKGSEAFRKIKVDSSKYDFPFLAEKTEDSEEIS